LRIRHVLAVVTAAVLGGGLAMAAPASAISGGHRVAQGAFPWMVRILPVQCGGTLISPQLVLTAKHCVDDVAADGFTVIAGAVDLDDPRRITVASTGSYAPPGFWGDHDWGLIRLARPVPVRTLPIATEERQLTTVTVAGWGASQWDSPQKRRLHRVDLPFLPDDDCAWTEGGYAGPYLCTSSVDQRSHCKGDSGGPGLHRLPDGRWEQVGIVSFGSDCDWAIGEQPQPVFTDVAYFAADIKRAARQLMARSR
jgi:secreted trypsin-like serine protease